MPDVVEVESTICLLACSECRDNRLGKEMFFEIAEVVEYPNRKSAKENPVKHGWPAAHKSKAPLATFVCRVVVISRLVLGRPT